MTIQIKSEDDIKIELIRLAKQINNDYKNVKCLDIICFINGASVFCSDLIRLLNIPIRLHHFGFSAYQQIPENGEIKIDQDLKSSIYMKDVLLLEGLIISGKTPFYLFNFFKSRNPSSIKLCALGIKKSLIEVDLNTDYYMFEFKDEWVEGYGIGSDNNKCLPYLVDARSTT